LQDLVRQRLKSSFQNLYDSQPETIKRKTSEESEGKWRGQGTVKPKMVVEWKQVKRE
jgi:hypothetical protein